MTTKPIVDIYLFGDSICFGQYVALHKGWVVRLSSELDALFGPQAQVTNAAVNGRTTRQALEDMPYQVQSKSPEILLVQFGLNDCNQWQTDHGVPRVSPAAFQANLAEMVDRAFASGSRSVILNTNHPTTLTTPFAGSNASLESNNRVYNDLIREVAVHAEHPVVLNDIDQRFRERIEREGLTAADFLLADGLHLNERGHDAYLEHSLPQIQHAINGLLL